MVPVASVVLGYAVSPYGCGTDKVEFNNQNFLETKPYETY